uniref:CSON005184 protein n=1 Tax=Culicoides sonorensis TaxID=179676 RepID=A0A336L5P8_CULSO
MRIVVNGKASEMYQIYGRWVTRKIAVATIIIIWLLAAFVSFVPISFGLHRPDQPVIYLDSGKKYPTCALDLTPTYAVVSSCISFYVPCIVMIGIYCRLHQIQFSMVFVLLTELRKM